LETSREKTFDDMHVQQSQQAVLDTYLGEALCRRQEEKRSGRRSGVDETLDCPNLLEFHNNVGAHTQIRISTATTFVEGDFIAKFFGGDGTRELWCGSPLTPPAGAGSHSQQV
jgi:hypothetical protein